MSDSGRGVVAGVAAYVIWGLFPLYWPLLEPASATEILAHRIFWSAVCMVVVVVALRRWRRLQPLVRDRRRLALLTVAAVVITVNWGVYIWAANNGHVVDASLGYFINPLFSVALGVFVLGERLRPLQWIAVAIAVVAVVVLTVGVGRPPWIALLLAASFGTYGLAKKKAAAGAFESLTVETLLLTPFALAYVVWLTSVGTATFGTQGPGHAALLVLAGAVTAVPLVLFGAAATRMTLASLGLLQYLAPILQFALGVWWLGEAMPTVRWVGFALVWVALVVFTTEALMHHRRRQLLLAAESSAA
ncbi:EamA family transporter RarD [Nocardioides malaquae]|uniref:EamA family transporter RarD n=1 Tax=Nocardioides malaquae TaxID=2773426 RepID=UPI0029D41C4B|nr:EamA family transporter RarD [Nocardioides malaquae]